MVRVTSLMLEPFAVSAAVADRAVRQQTRAGGGAVRQLLS
jgi:hypothetical protein